MEKTVDNMTLSEAIEKFNYSCNTCGSSCGEIEDRGEFFHCRMCKMPLAPEQFSMAEYMKKWRKLNYDSK